MPRLIGATERMGHEVPGMRSVYSHITPGMRENLTTGLSPMKVGAGTGHDGRLVPGSSSSGSCLRRIRPLTHPTCQRLMGITGIGRNQRPGRIGMPASMKPRVRWAVAVALLARTCPQPGKMCTRPSGTPAAVPWNNSGV